MGIGHTKRDWEFGEMLANEEKEKEKEKAKKRKESKQRD